MILAAGKWLSVLLATLALLAVPAGLVAFVFDSNRGIVITVLGGLFLGLGVILDRWIHRLRRRRQTDATMPAKKQEESILRRLFVIHPFLFALFFVLALYSANVTELSFSMVLPPLLVVVGCIVVILLLAWLLLGDARKAALLTSIEVILCLSYGHVLNLIDTQPSRADLGMIQAISGLELLIWLVWTPVFGTSVYFIRWSWRERWNSNLGHLTTLLNVLAAALIAVPAITVVVKEVRSPAYHSVPSDISDLQLSVPARPPDIYYIILDQYASASTLEQEYGFDNGEFLGNLSSKGFYVASESEANYLTTLQSLSSSLNMNYHDVPDENPMYAMLQDYRLWRCLKAIGYEFIHIGSWWEPTRENRFADINVNYSTGVSQFSRLLLKTSAIEPLGSAEMLEIWDERITQYERVKYEFDRLSQIPERDGPSFVFAHFIVPHGDYVFESNGDFLSQVDARKRTEETRYLDQLVAINLLVEQCIDRLIAGSDVPPIIILQGDHGVPPDFADTSGWMSVDTSDVDLRARSGILNAYYLPGVDKGILYPSITPVNSFRLVFNLYFGTSLELLADKTFYLPINRSEWVEITDRLG